jgi:hypothetical protein
LISVASHTLFAQAIYGSIAGTITDNTGGIVLMPP